MKRYEDYSNKIKTNFSNKLRYETLYFKNIEKSTSDIYIISKISDRLDTISFQYYGDSRFWFIIAKANNLGKGSLRIPPGSRIRIPFPIDNLKIQNALLDE
jgi:nucleoid-associated protein YgaU